MSYTLHKLQFLFVSTCVFFIYLFAQVPANNASSNFFSGASHEPCPFFDTVNVTGDLRFGNGSFLHQDLLIPPNLVGSYNYIYKDENTRIEVALHWRGCICKLRPCINFCCPWGSVYNRTEQICKATPEEMQWPEKKLTVTLNDESEKEVNIFEQFVVQNFRPVCEEMYILQAGPDEDPENGEFKLFENGTELEMISRIYWTRDQFCLMPTVDNDTSDRYVIRPANCVNFSETDVVRSITAYAMLFSIPFMLLTIFVYLWVPELRNQHGKSLVSYLVGLVIGYSLLTYISLSREIIGNISCKVMGYTAYYFFMAAFFWLSVISFDLWNNFRGSCGINRFHENKRFFMYSLYSWGLAAMCLALTWFAQEKIQMPEEYKASLGENGYCWLNMSSWSAMIYFFGPVLLIIVANTVMFIMTAYKIHKVQREMSRIIAHEDSTTNLRNEKDKFILFLRLFIVMGVTWSMEILSYLLGNEEPWSRIFYITDVCNAIQGFLIFLLFVMKKKVKQLIFKSDDSNQSSRTTSSRVSEKQLVPNEKKLSAISPRRRI